MADCEVIERFRISRAIIEWLVEELKGELETVARLVHHTSTIFYFTTIIISSYVLCFRPLSVSSPVSNVTSIGNMGANGLFGHHAQAILLKVAEHSF